MIRLHTRTLWIALPLLGVLATATGAVAGAAVGVRSSGVDPGHVAGRVHNPAAAGVGLVGGILWDLGVATVSAGVGAGVGLLAGILGALLLAGWVARRRLPGPVSKS